MVKASTPSNDQLASTARSVEDRPAGDPTVAPVQFASAAIGMGWQLAVVVLLPTIAGYKIDQVNGSSPLWTLAGLLLAIIGSIVVVRRTLRTFGNFTADIEADKTRNPVVSAGSTVAAADPTASASSHTKPKDKPA